MVQFRCGFEEQLRSVHFKAGGISPFEGDDIAAKGVIADRDVGHLDPAAGVAGLRQSTHCVGEAQHHRWLIDVSEQKT